MSSLSAWPWRKALKWYGIFRAYFFTVQRSSSPYLVVQLDEEEIERILGINFFTHDWEFSYKYRGEDVNMRRPLYKDDEYKWYQLHVRGFKTEYGDYELQAHTELEPSEYPHKHINGVRLKRGEGMDMLKKILESEGVEYKFYRAGDSRNGKSS